jgi:hypothetical protein
MHFRRNRARSHGKRGNSSDWTYPQVERGRLDQSRPTNRRRAAAANEEVSFFTAQYVFDDPRADLNDLSDFYGEWSDYLWEEWYILTEPQDGSYMPV